MSTALVTGCGGLIGTEAVEQFAADGYRVVGIDNNMRATFFGEEASTSHNIDYLQKKLDRDFVFKAADIRDRDMMDLIFSLYLPDVIVHTAAQPSHDWAARDPHTDFSVNANGTLTLLQATRENCSNSTFIHCSTSKVYGARPNDLPLVKSTTRLDVPADHRYRNGIDTTMSVDLTTHSLFGVSKLAGDLLVQEYGRYFDIPTVCFRPGCLTGGYHSGTELHGFLSYLMKCAITGSHYTVYGYDGLQVRCNIHSSDLVSAFRAFHEDPKIAAVYNIGGGRLSNCSMLEAIALCEKISGNQIDWTYSDKARIGDHKWWISNNQAFEDDYPDWRMEYRSTEAILRDIYDSNVERWSK